MKKAIGILIFFLLALLFPCCRKNNTGGEASIVAHTSHHDSTVKGTTVYVKFGTQEMPGDITTNYDLKATAEGNEDRIHIVGLRYGNYYLYAVGYDSSISQNVYGGVPVTIAWKERNDEIEIHIPVSE